MKKISLVIMLSVFVITLVSAESESWMSLGFESGHFFEHGSDDTNTIDSYMNSPGIAYGGYTFWNNKNVGLFIHDSFLFPTKLSTTINGTTTNADLSVYDLMMQVGIIVGPGFRYNISEQMKIHSGLGLSFLETVATYSQYDYYYGNISYSMLAFNFGVGGDIGMKYDITDSFYLDLGTIINYAFKNYTSIKSSFGSASAWSNSEYRMISLRPYLCLGLNFYKSNEGLGKKK